MNFFKTDPVDREMTAKGTKSGFPIDTALVMMAHPLLLHDDGCHNSNQYGTCPNIPMESIISEVSADFTADSSLSEEDTHGFEDEKLAAQKQKSHAQGQKKTSKGRFHVKELMNLVPEESEDRVSYESSSSGTGASANQNMNKDWGWFDDIHDSHGHGVTLKNNSADLKASFLGSKMGKSHNGMRGRRRAGRKGGMLYLYDAPLCNIVDHLQCQGMTLSNLQNCS